jgi:hypothetical protein
MAAVIIGLTVSPVHRAAADPHPFMILRVLSAYQTHQPKWNAARVVCRCGEEWEFPCPILEKTLVELGYPY